MISTVIAVTGAVIAVTGMRSSAIKPAVIDVTRASLTSTDYRVCRDSSDRRDCSDRTFDRSMGALWERACRGRRPVDHSNSESISTPEGE